MLGTDPNQEEARVSDVFTDREGRILERTVDVWPVLEAVVARMRTALDTIPGETQVSTAHVRAGTGSLVERPTLTEAAQALAANDLEVSSGSITLYRTTDGHSWSAASTSVGVNLYVNELWWSIQVDVKAPTKIICDGLLATADSFLEKHQPKSISSGLAMRLTMLKALEDRAKEYANAPDADDDSWMDEVIPPVVLTRCQRFFAWLGAGWRAHSASIVIGIVTGLIVTVVGGAILFALGFV